MRPYKKFILAAASAAMLPGALAAQEELPRELKQINAPQERPAYVSRKAPANASYQTQLVGFLYYADSWNDPDLQTTPMGIYTVDVRPGSMPQPLARIGVMNSHCNGGAVMAGDTFWYIWRQTDPSGTSGIDISQLYSYNVTTGKFENHGVVSSELASTSDHAWDPAENKIYGQYTINGSRKLCIVDYQEQTLTPVGDCYSYYGLAFDSTGQLWGIDNAGDLYKANKTNGSAIKVGSTGIVPKYSQSMTFDYKTGELYWASMIDAGVKDCSKLYKVDTATAKVTLVTAFEDNEEFMGLGVMPALAADNAPGYATNLLVTVSGASTDGEVSFTLPEYTYMGDDLSGEISYKVLANGNELFSGKGEKGAAVKKSCTLPAGDVTLSVVCSNSEGDGPAATTNCWVGEDYPLAPANVKFTIDEASGNATLIWDAVTEGQHGGYINPANITYSVTRYPGKAEVSSKQSGTSFSETLVQPELPQDYYYEVKALHTWRESEPAESNHLPFGKGFEVPYNNSFDDAHSLDLFYIIEGNGDNSTWEWSKFQTQTAYIFTGTDNPKPQDDWLITPGIDMKAGNRYQITYNIMTNLGGAKFKERMEVAFGLGVDPSSYAVAEEAFDFDGSKVLERRIVVTPEKDGYYHIGFHALSDCVKGLSINLDNLNVDVLANEDAPAKVTDLSIKTSQGTAPITLKFKTPTKRVNGKDLDKITKVEVYRNTSELVKSLEMTETGKQVTVVDNRGARGMTRYTVVAYNEHGVGDRVEEEIYLGLDIPGAPQNISLTDEGNGMLKLSWEKPKAGANGGYCDPSNLTYNVYAVDNGYAVDFKSGIRETELTISESDYYSNSQTVKYYAVAAQNSAGEGGAYRSSEVLIGNPYSYPFAESWVNGNARNSGWYRMSNGENGWYPEANYSSDNDNGCISFDAAQDGDLSYLCLGKVNVTAVSKPKLIFDYYALPGEDMYILPEINLAYTGKYATASAINFSALSGEAGWREAVIDLADLCKEYPYISVRFLGKGGTLHPLRIDNVRIMDSDKTPTLGFSGIGDIEIDNIAPARYYDLNGLEVTNPQRGTIYIVRTADGKTHKVIL